MVDDSKNVVDKTVMGIGVINKFIQKKKRKKDWEFTKFDLQIYREILKQQKTSKKALSLTNKKLLSVKFMDMLLCKKRASDRKAWLEEKGDLAEV